MGGVSEIFLDNFQKAGYSHHTYYCPSPKIRMARETSLYPPQWKIFWWGIRCEISVLLAGTINNCAGESGLKGHHSPKGRGGQSKQGQKTLSHKFPGQQFNHPCHTPHIGTHCIGELSVSPVQWCHHECHTQYPVAVVDPLPYPCV